LLNFNLKYPLLKWSLLHLSGVYLTWVGLTYYPLVKSYDKGAWIRMVKKYPMTQAGKEKLVDELTFLKGIKRKELDQQIKKARGFCDFSEDVSFGEMLNERSALDKHIESIEDMLYQAELIIPNKGNSSIITLGDTVTFVEIPNGEEETYTIVGTVEADPSQHKISSESPIGKSLLGKKENDQVSIQTPNGQTEVVIVRVN